MIRFETAIHRSRSGASVGGVCSGLAAWFGCHVSVVRVAYILLSAFTGVLPGVLAYLVLWLYLPVDDPAPAADAWPASAHR